jgi:serine/threonine protein phosphatase PrpC
MSNFSHSDANKGRVEQNLRRLSSQRPSLSVGTALEQNDRQSQQDRLFVAGFPAVTETTAVEFLRHVIETIDYFTKNLDSGSTFTGAVITSEGNVVTAHLGDSPASVICLDQACNLRFIQLLTPPHLPEQSERCRVASDGTKYFDTPHYRYLVNQDESLGLGIAVSRALGDRIFAGAVSHEPEVCAHKFESNLSEGLRAFLLVTSDGAGKPSGPSHTQHAFYLSRALRAGRSLSEIASGIAANSRISKDNVAVVLVEVKQGTGGMAAVLDGHGNTADVAQAGVQILEQQVARFVRSRA